MNNKEKTLAEICKEVIENNPDKANNYRLGTKGLLGFFVGLVVRDYDKFSHSEISGTMTKMLNEK